MRLLWLEAMDIRLLAFGVSSGDLLAMSYNVQTSSSCVAHQIEYDVVVTIGVDSTPARYLRDSRLEPSVVQIALSHLSTSMIHHIA